MAMLLRQTMLGSHTPDLSRVNVVGTSGVGKSTFAKKLAEKLRQPFIQMDVLFWGPNWKQPADEIFFPKIASALAQPTWILDGNYDRTLPVKWKNVTTVIWIDYSFRRTIYQAVTRALKRSIKREELWPGTGNLESFRMTFMSKDSIIWWTLKTFYRNRARYETRMADPIFSHIRFVRLTNPRAAQKFLRDL